MRACPHCSADNPYVISTRNRLKCRQCLRQYSEKTGTHYHASKLPIETLRRIETKLRTGASAQMIADTFNIQYRSAHRIRRAFLEAVRLENAGE